ncbi:MAG: indolepyruvate oxidoreductase subunit beta [Tissierellia bacterium]|nr:indolepyruvate oxidoreductase subunit beta [Tissierellia bacterium]
MSVTNILLVGVGGQGTVLASTILAKGLIKAGYDVKMSEIHGMSQRGGSVSTQVRFGKEVISPVIGEGEADIIVAFEKMEALRYLNFLKPEGSVIVNEEELPSAIIQAGLAKYPEGILEELKSHAKTYPIPATTIAGEMGNEKVMNVVLFGAMAKMLGLSDVDWKEVIKENVKPQFAELNLQAYEKGAELI